MRSVGDDDAEVLDIWRATLSRRIASLVPLKRRAPNGTLVLPAAASAYAGLEESSATVRAPLPVTVMMFPAVSVPPVLGTVGVMVCVEATPVPVKVAVKAGVAADARPQLKPPTAPEGISHLIVTSLPVPLATTRAVSNVNVWSSSSAAEVLSGLMAVEFKRVAPSYAKQFVGASPAPSDVPFSLYQNFAELKRTSSPDWFASNLIEETVSPATPATIVCAAGEPLMESATAPPLTVMMLAVTMFERAESEMVLPVD